MSAYKVSRSKVNVNGTAADLFTVGFDEPSKNPAIVETVVARFAELGELGGHLALVNGPASLPAAMAIAHAIAHRYAGVACFVPAEVGYVVAIAHGPDFRPGDYIPMANVTEAVAV